MLEVVLIVGVVICLAAALGAWPGQRANPESGPLGTATGPRPGEAPRARLRLSISGTQRAYLRDKQFVTGFGVDPRAVADIRIYAHFGRREEFPKAIVSLLMYLYERGCAVGADVMGVLFHDRALKEGEAIYFALVAATPQPRVVAFVDKLRTP